MTYSEEQVEWIVREVLRRLGATRPGPQHHAAGSDLHLTERVITMRSIEGRLHGVNQLVVPHRAVVTPAVKDELKQRKIQLIRKS
jgi:hypothetical protein